MNNEIGLAPINDINLRIFDEICEERLSKIDLDCILVSVIDNVPSSALPHLAEQYHITGNEGWLQALSEAEKRNLIKSAIKMHRYKGTKYALKEILQTLNINGEIKEWFEYNGAPYYFKVILKLFDRNFSEENEDLLLALICEYKNVRSHLERLEIYLTTKVNTSIQIRIMESEVVTIKTKRI